MADNFMINDEDLVPCDCNGDAFECVPADVFDFDEKPKYVERNRERTEQEVMAYALAHPIVCEEEEVFIGIASNSLDATELEMAVTYVQEQSQTHEEYIVLADKMNSHCMTECKAMPQFDYHEVNDRGRHTFYATSEYEGLTYSIGPCLLKKDIYREFLQLYFSETGRYMHLMAKFLMDSFEYVSGIRKDSYKWILTAEISVLETERGGIEHNFKSLLPGIKGTLQCCHQYLCYVMGYESIVSLANVPGYQESSGVVWKKLVGSFTSKDVYATLKERMMEVGDRRTPDGDPWIDGVFLSVVVDNRRDYYDLIRRHYLTKKDVVSWLQKRYSPRYALFVAEKVMGYRCAPKPLGERLDVLVDKNKPVIDGVRLMRSIVRILNAYPLGMRMPEIAREGRRTWTIDSEELGYVLGKYLDIKWVMRVKNGSPTYFLRPAYNQHFVRFGDDWLKDEDRYDKWRNTNNTVKNATELKLEKIFGVGKLSRIVSA